MGKFKRVAVVGGGIMGSGIAAFFANNNIPSDVYDLTLELAQSGISKLTDPKAKIPLLYSHSLVKAITPRASADMEAHLKEADLIIEVVPEVMKIKRDVFSKVDRFRKTGSIVATNTSGLCVKAMVEGMSKDLNEHFLGVHFFNPVRFLALVELIPITTTLTNVLDTMKGFFSEVGKKPVVGKDTPNFIANRVGIYSVMKTCQLMGKYKMDVETIDMITGPPLAAPNTGTFRLIDMVGVDTVVHASMNSHENCPNDESRMSFKPPAFFDKMVAEKKLGEKTGEGFYKKVKDPETGKSEISALDLQSWTYKPIKSPKSDTVRVAKSYQEPGERVKAMVTYGDEPISNFSKELIMGTAAYALNRVGEIADDIPTIDNAIKWGFNRDVGPIEVLDSIGIERSIKMMEKLGIKVPKLLEDVASAKGCFYEKKAGKSKYWDIPTKSLKEESMPQDAILLPVLKSQNKIVRENINATLIDLDDGVLLMELDAKMVPSMNPVDDFIISMMYQAMDEVKKKGYKGLIIGNQASNFCSGAQLQMILELSRAKRWGEIEKVSAAFQGINLALYHADFPVVVTPHGMTLGGGMEITLAGHKRVALAELYCGLVEVGVGLLPGGGGNLMLLMQFIDALKDKQPGPMVPVMKSFELIGFGTVSNSAFDAIDKGLLKRTDEVVVNKDKQIKRAKEVVLEMAKDHKPVPSQDLYLPGYGGYAVMENSIKEFVKSGKISQHSGKIAVEQAKVLTGGDKASTTTPVSEDYILDLEREAFVRLCGEKMSQERMEYMLKNKKPLIN